MHKNNTKLLYDTVQFFKWLCSIKFALYSVYTREESVMEGMTVESIGISCASVLAEYPFRARKQSFVNHLSGQC